MIWLNFRLAWASVKSAKLRSFLTMFAVIVGVSAFTIITTFFEGLRSDINNQIEGLGGNLITITPGQSVERDESGEITSVNFVSSFGASTLTEEDLQTVREIEGVTAAAPQMLVSATVERDGETYTDNLIMASNEDYPRAFSQEVEFGEFFSDDSENDNFIVIGSQTAEETFGSESPLGQKATIRSEEFVVIGVLAETEFFDFGFGPNLNKAVIMPLSAGKRLNNNLAFIQEIDAQVSQEADTQAVRDEIFNKILENHRGEEDFTVLDQDEFIGLTDSVFDQLKTASQFISYIMLMVSAVVIMLIMLIVVTERTREIGLRKSVGATNANILAQFLIEAVFLTWLGSIFGILFAWLLGVAVIKSVTDITPVYSLNTVLAVVAISTVVGGIAGLIPATKAARKDPIEAIRHE